MSKTNILNKDDPFYRYKRDIIKIRSDKSNKTFLLNINIIAEQLSRSPNLLIKYFQYELNTPSNIQKQFLQGNFSVEHLEKIIDKFSEEMIACKICANPETQMTVKTDIYLKCASCGGKSIIILSEAKSKLDKYIRT